MSLSLQALLSTGLAQQKANNNPASSSSGSGLGRVEVSDATRANMDRFLNRLLGMSLRDQRLLFTFFNSVHDAAVAEARIKGYYDGGIVTLRPANNTVMQKDTIFTCQHTGEGPAGGAWSTTMC